MKKYSGRSSVEWKMSIVKSKLIREEDLRESISNPLQMASKKSMKRKQNKEIDINPNWFDRGPEPKDLTTLVINIFLYRINVGLSLESQTVMSINGDYIYIVVKADDQDLRRIAEENNYTMQLTIGLTDLTSLEP
jgi:hypothetical protein